MSGPPPVLSLYRAATALLEPFAPYVLAGRARRGKEDAERLGERLGRASKARPAGQLVWLHGASVGESLSLLPLVAALRARWPSLSFLVTSGTVTSAALVRQRMPDEVIHQFAPIDAPGVAKRFLDHWRPSLAVFAESEIWPNLLVAARKRNIPTALVSARLSEKSLRGWARAPRSAKALLGGFRLVMAQDEATAIRLLAIGARDDGRLNLKLAAPPPPVDAARLEALRAAANGRPVLLAASTHPGEEDLALNAFALLVADPDRPLLVIVPRHPARGGDIVDLIFLYGLAEGRQSAGDTLDAEAHVYVADTLGELGTWFSLAGSALIGGSLLPGPGGHNPVEAAQLGAPMIAGPHVDNWREVYAALGDTVVRADRVETLAAAWRADLDAPEAAKGRAEKAKRIAANVSAGLETAADALVGLLP